MSDQQPGGRLDSNFFCRHLHNLSLLFATFFIKICSSFGFPLNEDTIYMPQYIFVYLGGEYPAGPEEVQKHFEKYQQWLISLGNAVVSPAIPFKDTHTVQADGAISPGTVTAMSGMSIIRLGSMEEALAAAKACPFLEIGGALEVSEMIEMTGEPGQAGNETVN